MATTNSPEQIPISNSFFLFNNNQTDSLLYNNPNNVVSSNSYNHSSGLKSDSSLLNQLDYNSYSFSPSSSFHSTMSNNDITNGTLVDNEDLNQLTITNMDEGLKNMLKQVSMNLSNSSSSNINNSSINSSFQDHLNSANIELSANKFNDSYNQHNHQQHQNAKFFSPQHQLQASHQPHHYLNNDEFEFFKYLESKSEPDNLFRRRINSCSNVDPMNQINVNMLNNLLQLYNNSNNNNSNTSINDSMSSAEQHYAEKNAHRNLRHNSVIGMTSTANNSNANHSIERENRAYSFSNLPIHNKATSPNSVGCLNSNCLITLTNKNESHFDQNLVKFNCNLCPNARYMHRVCYDKVYLDQLNSCNFKRNNNRQANEGSEFNKKHDPERMVVKIPCTSCSAGYLSLNNNQHSRYNNDKPYGNEMNVRKKSFCLNNPPVPVPMQPVHESRSPSPKTMFNSMASGSKYLTKRQSAPVNMPKNRNRTMSNGSTGSFSASSSFSSSMGTSFTIGSPNANNLAFKKNVQSQQTSVNGTFINPTLNANNSYYQINQANQINEVNLKLDAECLNNMLKTMADKLNIKDLEKFEEKIANTGNIFHQRDDWEIFKRVPLEHLNSFNVRIEDEGPFGNDDVRWFLLSYFSTLCIREMRCVLCDCELPIYDKFPLVDGTLFVSPVKYEEKDKNNNIVNRKMNNDLPLQCVPANISNKNQFIYAICLNCIHRSSGQIKCTSCNQSWKGAVSLQLGTMYKYEIFAAFPCCQKRLNCLNCDASIVNLEKTGGLDHFSSYSEEVECPKCKVKDFHFIKPLKQFYDISIPKNKDNDHLN